ncbi:TatA/E family twin arginine-targeting protein translocase [Synechococcus sp. PCC 7336]|uniref:TatA/E family twin arginine-targeting protein translocase n=1 Tax=Synechococcus sp. PCC 7336 TaxID=195250 RepID=UPI00037852EC|nr:TatA/E family twin arginine-targeting protein translocase [Synechococcus sp. PCC 7336]
MNIFGVGLPEAIVILAVALLVFGPKKLPEIGRTVAKTIKSLQDASKEFEAEIKREAEQVSSLEKQAKPVANISPPAADTEDTAISVTGDSAASTNGAVSDSQDETARV